MRIKMVVDSDKKKASKKKYVPHEYSKKLAKQRADAEKKRVSNNLKSRKADLDKYKERSKARAKEATKKSSNKK